MQFASAKSTDRAHDRALQRQIVSKNFVDKFALHQKLDQTISSILYEIGRAHV